MDDRIELWHIIDGKYVHIVYVIEGTKHTCYVDGQMTGAYVTNEEGSAVTHQCTVEDV
ncbi:MAG: hypothetical protein PVG39_02445 [Desulfobacteraceae bacterium]|jgi:hypothetical protein